MWSAPAASTISSKSATAAGVLCCGAWSLLEGPARSGRPRREARARPGTAPASFPEGYRHLAYLQSKIGYKVKKDMPGIEGPELDALYARGTRLSG